MRLLPCTLHNRDLYLIFLNDEVYLVVLTVQKYIASLISEQCLNIDKYYYEQLDTV
ncbi:hypothetical protein D3C73_583520 [compost metagenome]